MQNKKMINSSSIFDYLEKSDLYFKKAFLIIKSDSKDRKPPKRLGILKFEECKVFLEDFNDLNLFLKLGHKIIFNKCEIFIDILKMNYNKEDIGKLNSIMYSEDGKTNNFVILNADFIFQQCPHDFLSFTESVKKIKIQNLSFSFDYRKASDSKDSIPSLHEFNNSLKSIFIRNANLNKFVLPYCQDIFIENSIGNFFSMSRDINIKNSDLGLKILSGTNLYIKDGSSVSVNCNGKFNIYFDSPINYGKRNLEILSGSIMHTNKKDLLEIKPIIHKYKVFMGEDFSDQDYITQFYNCKFYNCYFNSNQFILDSEFVKCFFSEGKQYIKYT